MQFIIISVPNLQPDGLNMETRIERTIYWTHMKKTKQKKKQINHYFIYIRTVHLDSIKVFYALTNAQVIALKQY